MAPVTVSKGVERVMVIGSRVLAAMPAVGCRGISTSTRRCMREMFRELKDLGFAPRFRDQHSRMIGRSCAKDSASDLHSCRQPSVLIRSSTIS